MDIVHSYKHLWWVLSTMVVDKPVQGIDNAGDDKMLEKYYLTDFRKKKRQI